jgi:hypothetical protein
MILVNELDGLFESDGDEDPEGDGADVDEEVGPCVGRVVGRVDVDHAEQRPRVGCAVVAARKMETEYTHP